MQYQAAHHNSGKKILHRLALTNDGTKKARGRALLTNLMPQT
jgi:hypothetical protein